MASVRAIDRLSVLHWTFFLLPLFKTYFSKLVHGKSGHCRPFQISNLFQSFDSFSSF